MLNSRILEENRICLRLCCWTYLPKLDKNESHKVEINEVDFIKSSCQSLSLVQLCNPMDCSLLLKRQKKQNGKKL